VGTATRPPEAPYALKREHFIEVDGKFAAGLGFSARWRRVHCRAGGQGAARVQADRGHHAYGVNHIGWGLKADDERKKAYFDGIRVVVSACVKQASK
jgi:hypothetical protein